MTLAKEFDGLLALATAGAYLDQVATSFSDYLRLYKASWLKLQTTSPKLVRRSIVVLNMAAFIRPRQATERTFGQASSTVGIL